MAPARNPGVPGNSHCLECVRARRLSLSVFLSNVCVSLCICTWLSVFAELLPGKMRGGAKKLKASSSFSLLLSKGSSFSRTCGPGGGERKEVGGCDLL